MKCLACNSVLLPYFVKNFNSSYDLNNIHYDRCTNCGLVVARELLEMPLSQWEILNNKFHSSFLGKPEFDLDPNWNKRIDAQVKDIRYLHSKEIVDASICLDYACGDGRLKQHLQGWYGKGKNIYCVGYDKYTEFNSNCSMLQGDYSLVVNTSFFEHVRHRDSLDEVNKLVADDGVLALHTLVCEEVPRDPDWFYLVPVHSVVYTNKSMQMLFDQWGYKCSIYNPDSRMWFLFRRGIDKDILPSRFIYKEGFVDYWK